MKIKIGNIIHDLENEPAVLIFRNDDEMKQYGKFLCQGENKGGVRKLAIAPELYDQKELEKYMDFGNNKKYEDYI